MSEPVMWRTPPRHGSFMAGQAPAHAHRRPTRWLALCAALAFLAFASTLARAQSDAAVLQAIESPRAATSLLLDVARAGERLVVVGDRGHILYSDDDGGRWVQARVPTRQMLTSVYFVDDRHGWAVGHDAQILATTDGGATWRRQFEDRSREAPLLGVWFRDLQTGYAVGAYGALLETTDGGQHWQDVGDRLDNQDGYHLNAIAAVEGAGLFIVGEMGILFRSTDWGHTWVSVESPYEGSLFGVLATGEPHTLLVYGLRGHLFRSEDFGDSWTRVAWGGDSATPLEYGLADGARQGDGGVVVVGHGGTVLRSDDHGRHFTLSNRPDRLSLAGVTVLDNGNLILVGQGGIHLTAPSGADLGQR